MLIVSDRMPSGTRSGVGSVLAGFAEHLPPRHEVRLVLGARGGARSRAALELEVRRAAQAFRPDVALSFGPSLSLPCPVVDVAGGPILDEPQSALVSLRRSLRAGRRAATCLVPTESSCALIAAGRTPLVVPTGVDTERYSPPDARSGKPRLVFLGRLVPERGAHIALEVLDGLPGWARDAWHLDVVGAVADARYFEGLQRKADGLPCTLHGDVPDVVPFLRRASLAVLPATSEDGWGRAQLEAMACGVPVLTSKGGVLQAITGGHAEHVPAGNLKALGDGLRALLRDDVGRAALASEGRAHVLAHHAWPVVAPRWIEALERLIGSS